MEKADKQAEINRLIEEGADLLATVNEIQSQHPKSPTSPGIHNTIIFNGNVCGDVVAVHRSFKKNKPRYRLAEIINVLADVERDLNQVCRTYKP